MFLLIPPIGIILIISWSFANIIHHHLFHLQVTSASKVLFIWIDVLVHLANIILVNLIIGLHCMGGIGVISTFSKFFLWNIFITLLGHAHQISNLLCLTLSHAVFENVVSIHSIVVHKFILRWTSWVFAHVNTLVHFLILLWSDCTGLRTIKCWLTTILARSWWLDSVTGDLTHLLLLCTISMYILVSRFWCIFLPIFADHLLFHMLHALLCNYLSPCWSALTSYWDFLFGLFLGVTHNRLG